MIKPAVSLRRRAFFFYGWVGRSDFKYSMAPMTKSSTLKKVSCISSIISGIDSLFIGSFWFPVSVPSNMISSFSSFGADALSVAFLASLFTVPVKFTAVWTGPRRAYSHKSSFFWFLKNKKAGLWWKTGAAC
jgi:hypothetical protein